ncbi:Protein shisa-like-2A [Dissostichus eleginoides]|uniref:Protein shisa-like-2A n=1 Tax=Dissostichus eleginoides TaxID=100907 RepID=A0AAD9B5K5_DISEL|nr:Protein shisa-like-2A [Dissostichus eleginoides]
MSAECSSYSSADGAFVDGFSCPRAGNAALLCTVADLMMSSTAVMIPTAFSPMSTDTCAGDPSEGPSRGRAACISGPQGFRKHFMSRKLDCDNQPPDPELLFQRCFTATVVGIKVENPS